MVQQARDLGHSHTQDTLDTFLTPDVLTFTDQAANPDAAGEVQRNGVDLYWHNGALAGRLFFAGGVDIPVADGGTGASTLTGYVKGNGASAFTAQAVPIPVTDGGTAGITMAANGVLYGQGASAVLVTAQGPANSVLTANAGAPSFSADPTLTSMTATSFLSAGASPAGVGALRVPNNDGLYTRNAAGSGDIALITIDPSNVILVGNAGALTISASTGAAKLGSPTSGFKGAGTLNAVAVYDDGVLLTDHVFDAAVDGPCPIETYPERLQAWVAQFDPAWLDPDAYEAHWRTHRRLPLMPESVETRPALGGMVNTLVLHLEVMAVHNAQLRQRGRAHEQRIDALEARLAALAARP